MRETKTNIEIETQSELEERESEREREIEIVEITRHRLLEQKITIQSRSTEINFYQFFSSDCDISGSRCKQVTLFIPLKSVSRRQ